MQIVVSELTPHTTHTLYLTRNYNLYKYTYWAQSGGLAGTSSRSYGPQALKAPPGNPG